MPETGMFSKQEISKAREMEANQELAAHQSKDRVWNDRVPPFWYVGLLTFKIVMASALVSAGIAAVGSVIILVLKSIFGRL
jgi:hypothetical protein